jgi:hypothetical protein
MMLALLVANPQNKMSQIISFSVSIMSFFIYIGSILICFHDGSSVCITRCILFWLLHCVVRACEISSVFIPVVMAKYKCSINDSIKSEYPFIKVWMSMLNAHYAMQNSALHMVVGQTSSVVWKQENIVACCLKAGIVVSDRKLISWTTASIARQWLAQDHCWATLGKQCLKAGILKSIARQRLAKHVFS